MKPFVYLKATSEERPLLLSIPHTGVHVPREIDANFATDRIRSLPMTDWHLHHLYDFLPAFGVDVLHATHSRFVVDLNRPPQPMELYPGRFETGLVATQTFEGEEIYLTPPGEEEIEERRKRYYEPYHERLSQALEEKKQRFGAAFLIDAHSIASHATLINDELKEHIYLGDRDGTTCVPALTDFLDASFSVNGLRVSRNVPFKGGYITHYYGGLPGVQALQIEMCERVYMDESDPPGALAHPRFAEAKQMLGRIFSELVTSIGARDFD